MAVASPPPPHPPSEPFPHADLLEHPQLNAKYAFVHPPLVCASSAGLVGEDGNRAFGVREQDGPGEFMCALPLALSINTVSYLDSPASFLF